VADFVRQFKCFRIRRDDQGKNECYAEKERYPEGWHCHEDLVVSCIRYLEKKK